MKVTIKKLFITNFIMLFLMLSAVSVASAHPSSQEGILSQAYDDNTGRYYIGGESVGWSIDEKNHTNGTTLTYKYITSDSTATQLVLAGMDIWKGYATFKQSSSGTGTFGLFSDESGSSDNVNAKFHNYVSDSSGHLKEWKIDINIAKLHSITGITIAHEIGHAFGLNDLYDSSNRDKLMYGINANRTATCLHQRDIQGFQVITGVHTSHTWAYKHYAKPSSTNYHIKYCKICNGLTTVIEGCTYNPNNICIKCGVPYGVSQTDYDDNTNK